MKYVLFAFVVFAFTQSSLAQNTLRSPNVSANALLLYRNSNFAKEDTSTERNGFDVQEAEIAFYADVDPYSRLSLLLGIHPEYELDGTTNEVVESWGIEPEELFAELTQVPAVTLKLGKFKAAFGKHNLLHSHTYPFVDAPLVNTTFLGDEGLNDVGISAAGLLPANWFSEVTLQYLRGAGENDEFDSPTPGDGVGLGHWKNLWDLSEALTLEVGVSYAQGANSLATTTSLAGADLTFKWRPSSGGKYQSWILGAEWIERKVGQVDAEEEKSEGAYVWGQHQFAEAWSVLVRIENVKEPLVETIKKSALSFVYSPTEFSSYRIEYDVAEGLPANVDGETKEQKLYLQANFTIGAHPSHSY